MGVQNLWMLLAPVGRQIEIESLEGKVLAVDASIWLTQFVKAMRDDEGKMIRNAHVLGTFHRVAKLLFYGIKPVFVFDGQTPEIKKRTTARRRKRQQDQTSNLKQTAQRILINRIKMHQAQMKRNGGKAAPAVDPGYILVDDTEASEPVPSAEQIENDKSHVENTVETVESSDVSPSEIQEEDFVASDTDEMAVEDIELGDGPTSTIDLDAVFAMPPHLQKDMIERIRRDRRQEARETFIPLAGAPEDYSRAQIASFLKTTKLNKRIGAAKAKKHQEDAKGVDGRTASSGQRIDSTSDRYFMYEKEPKEPEKKAQEYEKKAQEYEKKEEVPVVWDDKTEGKPKKKIGELSFDGSFQHAIGEKFEQPESKSVVQEADAPSSTYFPTQVEKEQWKSNDVPATTGWEFGKWEAKPEPMLAIEKARLKRLGQDVPEDDQVSSYHSSSVDKESNVKKEAAPISISFRMDEVSNDDKDMSLFPASMFDKSDINEEQETEEEDDVEWEDVDTDMNKTHGSTFTNETSDDKHLSTREETKEELEQEQDEETTTNPKDGEDELYMNLRNELEDAKGEKDLEALRSEALNSAITTASNLTQWAAGAVRRALAQHAGSRPQLELPPARPQFNDTAPVDLTAEDKSKAVEESTSTTTSAQVNEEEEEAGGMEEKVDEAQVSSREEDDQLEQAIQASLSDPPARPSGRYLHYQTDTTEPESDVLLAAQQEELKKLRNRQQRDVEGFDEEMVQDVMHLLQLFGVPYLVCPAEAEAQCTTLEELGLVDGVITDDSDVFPFGGQKVYKNIFHHQKFVEAFDAQDVERELGFGREELIALALLLGSDYTDGVKGVGIVNATEIVTAYPGVEGLKDFKDWVQSFNLLEEATKEKRKSDGEKSLREKFEESHAKARRKWELGDEFPNTHVVKAYKQPQVDKSDARFSWSLPDVEALRTYSMKAFGWDGDKSDGVLQPVVKKQKEMAEKSSRGVQTRMEDYFRSYKDQVKYASIKSKRLREAVEGRATKSNKTSRK